MDTSNYAYFVLLESYRSRATSGFTGYQDENGEIVYLYMGQKDRNGDFVPRYFKFNRAKRYLYVNRKEKDLNGKNVADFLRNHNLCEGSAANLYHKSKPMFREMDEGKDAEVAINYKTLVLNAGNAALALDTTALKAAANLCGCFSESESTQRHRVMEYAGTEPQSFLDIIGAPDFSVRALIKGLINKGVIKREGTMLKWENTLVGTDENAAVAKLIGDEDLFNALSAKLTEL